MGAAVSAVAPILGSLASVASYLPAILFGKKLRNLGMAAIEEEHRWERQAREEAERMAEKARQAEAAAAQETAKAKEAQAEAERQADALRRAQAETAEALRRTEAEAAEMLRRAQAEAAEELRRVQAEAAEFAEQADNAAETARVVRQAAEEEATRIAAAFSRAKKDWEAGIQPIVWPTEEEYNNTLRARQYKEGYFHFAVAGIAGCGKSSLINAFRGILDGSRAAAAVGVTETTKDIGRYPDPRQNYPFVWYDIPGAGTLDIPRWEYFNKQGLFIFDCIILLWSDRLTDTDVAILDNCARFPIPCFIVRSKSDGHIRSISNRMKDLIEEDRSIEDEEREELLDSIPSKARAEYCAATRESVQANLQKAELPSQKVYMVTNRTLCKVVKGSKLRADDQEIIDEADLICDILAKAHETRCAPRTGTQSITSRFTERLLSLSNAVSSGGSRWIGNPSTH